MVVRLDGGRIYNSQNFSEGTLDISEDGVSVFKSQTDANTKSSFNSGTINCNGKYIIPGFADVHVHFREPGFSYKETIRGGSEAAARGGYCCVCTMPNLKPVPSTMEGLRAQLDIIERDAVIPVVPYGAITINQDGRSRLSDMEEMAPYVCAFSDDGRGVQEAGLMRDAMEVARELGKIITAHCEDESLLGGSSIHDGDFARSIGHRGISSESEWRQIERDVKLADETGCAYHVCHISTKESVEIIRDAKKSGVDVSCETGPHYLSLCDDNLYELNLSDLTNGRFKMNPPLRSRKDRTALIEGVVDGTIDMVATDHAPHSAEEKAGGLLESAFGIVGLETALPVIYTDLVLPGIITMERLVELMSLNPVRRFNLPVSQNSWTVIDVADDYLIDSARFSGIGRATPFDGKHVKGRVDMNIVNGRVVYRRKQEG